MIHSPNKNACLKHYAGWETNYKSLYSRFHLYETLEMTKLNYRDRKLVSFYWNIVYLLECKKYWHTLSNIGIYNKNKGKNFYEYILTTQSFLFWEVRAQRPCISALGLTSVKVWPGPLPHPEGYLWVSQFIDWHSNKSSVFSFKSGIYCLMHTWRCKLSLNEVETNSVCVTYWKRGKCLLEMSEYSWRRNVN